MFDERMSIMKRIKEAISPTPIRRRVTAALYKLKVQEKRLEKTAGHIQQRDSQLYNKCLGALQKRDHSSASLYANECAELRKIAKVIFHSQLALERVTLRLETVQQFGDIFYVMKPVASVVKTIKNQLEAVLPNISMELGRVNEELEEMVLEAGNTMEVTVDTSASTEEAQRILDEANAVAEQKMKQSFPELPAVPSREART